MAGLLLVAAALGVVLLAIGMFPADLPSKTSPGFHDTIFDNRGVIWAARLLLVSAAAVLAFGTKQLDESDELVEQLHELLSERKERA